MMLRQRKEPFYQFVGSGWNGAKKIKWTVVMDTWTYPLTMGSDNAALPGLLFFGGKWQNPQNFAVFQL